MKPQRVALIKAFQGAGFPELVAATLRKFAKVKLCQSEASRARSPEGYLLARQYSMV